MVRYMIGYFKQIYRLLVENEVYLMYPRNRMWAEEGVLFMVHADT